MDSNENQNFITRQIKVGLDSYSSLEIKPFGLGSRIQDIEDDGG